MIEMVVAIFIFAIVATSVAAAMGSSLGLSRQNRSRSVAANLAAQDMDAVRLAGFSSLPLGTTTTTQTVDGIDYTVARQTRYVTGDGSIGTCGAAAGSKLSYLTVKDSVTWANMNGTQPVTSSTLLTPPAGTASIEVQVLNPAPVPGVAVSLTGTDTASGTTDANGCALISGLDSGTYTVTISKAGYVDINGNTSPSQTASIYPGYLTPIAFQFAQSVTASITLSGASGAPMPSSGAAVTLANTTMSGNLTSSPGSSPVQVSGLYPYSNGYQAWAGTCADAKPTASTTPSATQIPTTDGSYSATVQLPRLTVNTQKTTSGNPPRSGVTVTASHAADSSCTGGESYTLGATNSSGTIVVALPLGTYTIAATGASTTACTGSGSGGIVTGSGSTITSTPCKVKLTSTSTMPTATFKW
jgi:Tfp pilus assembly protein PilV